jgi:DNA-binding CsgD family transcriptional regulator
MTATRPSGFLGRTSERDLLDGLLANVRGGESDVLVIRGEAGIGKTALLRYAARQAAGFQVAQVTGMEAEMELPFAGTHQLCTPMLAHLDALPRPQRDALSVALGLATGDIPDPFLVGLAVLGLLSAVAEERPLLCLVEDAQWLDAASSQVLGFVARRVLAESVAIVVAVRGAGGSDSVRDFDGLPELRLEGLQEDHARALLSGAVPGRLDDRVRDRIVAETRGNPLALLELPGRMTAAELAGGFELPPAQDLPAHIEDHYLRRVGDLPEATQRLLLLAAADPLGDATLVWRAGRRLDIESSALAPAEDAKLLEIGARVRFRHPLVRSAVYRAASPDNRQRVHEVLAEVSDPEADADRRAWHRSLAAAGPDEDVAAELERSAGRAQARGGVAATAAFLQRAVALTPDPTRRRGRALAAAQASLQAGAFDAARGLLATAEAGALDELQRARIELLRAEVAFASKRGSTAPASLLRAAKRIEPLDARLARASYLEALSAALFAARLAGPGGGVRDVANAVQAAPSAASPRSSADVLLDGWAALFADGCAAAAPTLREALREFGRPTLAADQLHLLWLVTITAPVVWDDARWEVLSRRHVELARSSGAVSELPLALNSRIYVQLFRGEPEIAGALIEEARVAIEATGASLTPWGALALAVLRGHEQDACTMLDVATADASQRGEGISLTVIAWARAILYNGLRVHDKALAAAQAAIDCPTNSAAAAWGMVELIEAAARVGEPEAAGDAARRFAEIAAAAGTDWALGVDARSRALLSTGATAEQLYHEALDHLGRCQMRMDLARAHLLYGEWLRRENRRVEARAQLRAAHDQFTSMSMEAFAERAGSELLATGEKVRKRTVETREDLTAQERHIAQLARDGLSNAEIGARLFLSPRTVEWHLHHVFSKLGIRSRRQLASALPASESEVLHT